MQGLKFAVSLLIMFQCALIAFSVHCIYTANNPVITAIHFGCILTNIVFGIININTLMKA